MPAAERPVAAAASVAVAPPSAVGEDRAVARPEVAGSAAEGRRGAPRWFAALVALGLGAGAAALMVAGHHPWDGRQVSVLTSTHGLHVGDAFALGPLLAGAWLARWSWRHGHR